MFVKVGILVQQPFHIKSPHFAGVGVVGRPFFKSQVGFPLDSPNHNLKNLTVQDFQSEFYNFAGVTLIKTTQIAESFEGHH